MLEDYLSYEKIRRGIPLTKKTMNRNETIVWLIEKSREPKDTANKENGEKERVEEQEDENRNAEFPSTEKSDQLMSLPSLESIPSSADHKLSQFSDVSDTTTNVKEGPSASDANRQ
ncbi:unnamed protein product [Oikopleura dioica]|uniref:Uncharacterized protein n=1 Tax=Oikopleura dioica TaxID=34765 RepID=E4YZV8_OIKDI|nr:unnamed protein product [Oikopleura dioica]